MGLDQRQTANRWEVWGRVGEFSARHCIQHFTCVTSFNFYRSPLKMRRPKKRVNKARGKTHPRMVRLQSPWSYWCVGCLSKWLLNFPLKSMSEAQNRLNLISHLLTLKLVQDGYFSPKSLQLDLEKWALPHLSWRTFASNIDVCQNSGLLVCWGLTAFKSFPFPQSTFWIVCHSDTCGVPSPAALGWDGLWMTLIFRND